MARSGSTRRTDRSIAEHDIVIGADGAYSVVRERLTHVEGTDFSQQYLPWGYKELSIPPRDGEFALDPGALHIWPRGGSMMIALPNVDRSFTATLFWPNDGPSGFAGLDSDEAIIARFRRDYPDAVELMPDLPAQFRDHPIGALVTVHCWPWVRGRAALIGDAAHAIVPFYGQGMNCGFEDVVELDRCLAETGDDWSVALPRYAERRRPNADAIAELALDNFVEMRDRVASPIFRTQKRAEHALERVMPEHFVSLYELVSFSTVPYAEAVAGPRIRARRPGPSGRPPPPSPPPSRGASGRTIDDPTPRSRRRPPGDGGPAQLRRVPASRCLLGAQHPRTDAHDEVLFIIQHQATEVWFKLVLHELRHVMAQLDGDELRPAFKGLSRIERIMLVLNEAWDILTTLTPADYSAFRDALGQSSGFQSYQYREFEFLLGNRDEVYLGPFKHLPRIHDQPRRDPARAVALRPHPGAAGEARPADLARGARPRRHEALRRGSVGVGRVAGGLLGHDHALGPVRAGRGARGPRGGHRRWRFRHVTTVERVIGGKRGTGGTPGVPYLRDRVATVLFPELWQVRTEL